MKLTIVSVSTVVLSDIVRVYSKFKLKYPDVLELKLYNATRKLNKEKLNELKIAVEEADIVIIDLMGSPAEIIGCVLEALKNCCGCIIPIGNGGREFLRLGSLNAGDMAMDKSSNKGKASSKEDSSSKGKTGSIEDSSSKGKIGSKEDSSNIGKMSNMRSNTGKRISNSEDISNSDADLSGKNVNNRGGGMDAASMQKMMDMAEKMGKLIPFGKPRDMRNFVQIGKYWKNAGEDEIENLIYLLLRDYGGNKTVPKPRDAKELEELCICSPSTGEIYKNFEQYRFTYSIDAKKPVVALLYYGHSYPNKTHDCVAAIEDKFKEFANILPIAFTRRSDNDMKLLEDILLNAAGKRTDLIINFMSFRLGAGPMGGDAQAAIEILDSLNAPVLHPFFMSKRSREEWLNSAQGSTSSEFLISVMLPELDGCIETYPVGAMESRGMAEEFDLELNELALIDERVEKLASRAKRWFALREMKNCDKKVAVICYNYPPGEGNIFGGAFLDTFESVANILKVLKEDGYFVNSLTTEQLMEYFTAGVIVNSPRWSEVASNKNLIRYNSEDYKNELQGKFYSDDMQSQWGKPPGEVMSDGTDFFIPGLVLGNVFIGLQPSRGVHEDPEKAYHDKALLPHHQYIAFYKWVRDVFKADVIMHVGTHGTFEFLKGKECGMSGNCFPDMLIGDVPHAYLYYIGNPSEAMIAKRRSHAVMVGYQPPVFMEGGLYGEITAISAMVDEYYESLRVSPVRSQEVLSHIYKAAEKNNLPRNLDELEKELYRMKRTLIPKGLHCFGKSYTREEAVAYAGFVLRYDRGEIPALRRVLAQSLGLNYDMLLEQDEVKILKELDEKAREVFMQYVENGSLPDLKEYSLMNSLMDDLTTDRMTYMTKDKVTDKKESVIKDMIKSFMIDKAADMQKDITMNMRKSMATDMHKGMTTEMQEGMKTEMQKDMTTDMTKNIKDDIKKGMLTDKDINKAMKNDMKKNSTANGMIKGLMSTLDYGLKLIDESIVNHETQGLLRVLDGGYLPSRLSGDIIRNPEVLPAGFNLYQFDPRFVPTPAAYERGRRIAENTILQYQKDHGEFPESTAVILWGLETSRTQGETVGQILTYLGVKAIQGKNAWEPKYEILSLEDLQRPRVDVVINICGFFRDMFPNLINNINDILERLACLDEPEEMNFYRKNCRKIYEMLMKEGYEHAEALELSRSRIFGPAEAEYGTGITKLIETKNWEDEKQIGEMYIKSLKHVYSKNYRGRAVEGLLDSNLRAVDVVSQIRSSHEYEVTDLDHYYEFFGGLAKSVEMAKGKKCEIYISDSTGERMETESVEKSIARGVRTRLLNPKWIDGMLEHKYHGVQKIEQRFENMVGLAATTNRVDNWIFSSLHEKYVSDGSMRKRLEENNRWAYLGIVERLMELNSRGYWKATDTELEELKQVYLELEGNIEGTIV